jgi:N-acetylmuramoyl-L-alanine amidase
MIILFIAIGLIVPGTFSSSLKQVKQVRHWTNPQYSRVVIDVTGEVGYKYNNLRNPARIYVDVQGALVNPNLRNMPIPVEDGLLKRVRIGQNKPNVVRVVLDLAVMSEYRVFKLYNPYRIVIDVFNHPKRIKEAKSFHPPHKYKPFHSDIRRIVIDPGHGGKDPGAIGPGGLKEKDLTLDIALRLARLLRTSTPYQVILTRDRDIYLPLEERTAIANREEADLFISIHINASKRRALKGIETYLLDFSSDPDSMSLAARENFVPRNKLDGLQIILQDLMLTSKINESSALAEAIQFSLVQHLRGKYDGVADLGVKRGPFYVLFGALMPSILVECLFLTNTQDRARLLNPDYRQRIAQALLAGINNYNQGEVRP